MASKLPKPSGLKLPLIKMGRPLEPISENKLSSKEAPASLSRMVPAHAHGLKRRSKSVTDLRMKPTIDLSAPWLPLPARRAQNSKKIENKAIPASSNRTTPPKKGLPVGSGKPATTLTRPGISGTKRPLPAAQNNNDGQPKPKVQKKFPDWDYKNRFLQLNEKYTSALGTIKEMKLKTDDFDELKKNYVEIQEAVEELKEIKEKLSIERDAVTSQKSDLLEKHEKLEVQFFNLEKEYRQLYEDFNVLQENNKKLTTENEANILEVSRLSSSLSLMTSNYNDLIIKHKELSVKHAELCEELACFTRDNKELIKSQQQVNEENLSLKQLVANQKSALQEFEEERRIMHNKIQDLKGNIRVFCRVRPPINAEEEAHLQCSINFIEECGLEIRKSRESVSQITGRVQECKSEFLFDRVFAPNSTQEEIFGDLSQLVQSALDGYHVCVFAYGQTGSGKTYTMQGGDNPESKGMIPRTVDLIFQNISKLERTGWSYKVQASFLEIYNEIPHDLLNINGTQKLEICFNEGKGTTVTNLTIQPIESADELKKYMKLAHQNRATAATDFNQHSSRSHAVTKIYLEGTMGDQNIIYKGSLNLVDLAGSENAKQAVQGERLTETKNINKSLATLGDVISALHGKSKHVPYRNSKLTYLLQSCLGGNSKTLMVVNISPFEECYNESLSSLRFAAKVKEVKTISKKNKMIFEQPKQKSSLR